MMLATVCCLLRRRLRQPRFLTLLRNQAWSTSSQVTSSSTGLSPITALMRSSITRSGGTLEPMELASLSWLHPHSSNRVTRRKSPSQLESTISSRLLQSTLLETLPHQKLSQLSQLLSQTPQANLLLFSKTRPQ
jgi:hypothetical protein